MTPSRDFDEFNRPFGLRALARDEAWQVHQLATSHALWTGRLPHELMPGPVRFQELWDEHPLEYSELMMHGRLVPMPRWQAIYGADYHFSGSRHVAAPIPDFLVPWVNWARSTIEPLLNGAVVNWYDARLGHYIGKHRDSTTHMIVGAPIVMLSFGEQRTLRLRPWKRAGEFIDFPVDDGAVVILPYATNLAWTHEITKSKHCLGRRISVTLRAFEMT